MDENTIMLGHSVSHIPADATLKKYGLSFGEWLDLYNRQGGKCGICRRDFQAGRRINVDHEHVKGWKHMPPEERKQHVRGLLCYTCNRFMLMKGVSSDRLFQAWQYMRNWEVRITKDALTKQEKKTRANRKG